MWVRHFYRCGHCGREFAMDRHVDDAADRQHETCAGCMKFADRIQAEPAVRVPTPRHASGVPLAS